jgi:hypothetical protein
LALCQVKIAENVVNCETKEAVRSRYAWDNTR